jgi:outer membrane protein assembly factor BamB
MKKILMLLLTIPLLCLAFQTSFTSSALETNNATVTPWPMFRHDPRHTGYTTSTSPSTLQSVWNQTTNGPGAVTSSPAVAADMVFVGGEDSNVYAFDQNTGTLKWVRYVAKVHSSPAYSNGMVFVGSYDGKIYALNASTGLTIWSKQLAHEIYASPAVVDGRVFITAYDIDYWHYAWIYALNETSGATIWSWAIYGDWFVNAFSSPAVSGGRVFFGAHYYGGGPGRSFVASNATTGSLIWEKAFSGSAEIWSSPGVDETQGTVYVGSDDGKVYGLDVTSGDIVRLLPAGGSVQSSPAIGSNMVVFGANDKQVYGYTNLGAKIWNYTTGGPVRSSPAIASGRVFVGSDDGYIYILNLANGNLLSKFNLGNKVESSPAVADGMVFVGCDSGKVHAFGGVPPTIPTRIQCSLTPNPVEVGNSVTLLGNLTRTDNNMPISGAAIKLLLNNALVGTLTTNSTGWFKAVGQVQSPGTYNLVCSFAGTAQYMPSNCTTTLTVKAQTDIYAKIFPNPTTPGATLTLKGILVNQFSVPVQSATISLQYSANWGVTWTSLGNVTTNSYGIFSKTLTAPIQLGTYVYRMSYVGSPTLGPSTDDILLAVR